MDKKEVPKEQRDTANRIYSIRNKMGYTQEKFAEILDVGYSTYKKIERAESGITVKQLRILKNQLGVSSDHVLFGDNEDFDATWIRVQNLSEKDKLHMFLRLHTYLKEICREAYKEQKDWEKQDGQGQDILELFKMDQDL